MIVTHFHCRNLPSLDTVEFSQASSCFPQNIILLHLQHYWFCIFRCFSCILFQSLVQWIVISLTKLKGGCKHWLWLTTILTAMVYVDTISIILCDDNMFILKIVIIKILLMIPPSCLIAFKEAVLKQFGVRSLPCIVLYTFDLVQAPIVYKLSKYIGRAPPAFLLKCLTTR